MSEHTPESEVTPAGFYCWDGDTLLHGPNFVLHADYELHADLHETYTYPVHGWIWCETRAEAVAHFDLPPEWAEREGAPPWPPLL